VICCLIKNKDAMANLPLLKQKKDIHICKQFGVMEEMATSLTHPTGVSMGMNMRLLGETNLVVVILSNTSSKNN